MNHCGLLGRSPVRIGPGSLQVKLLGLASKPISRQLYLEPEEPEVAIDNRDLLETLMRSLPLKHRAACEAVYFKGLKQVAAANELRMSQSRLSTLIRESIEIMKDTAKLLDDRFEKKLAQLAA